MQATTTIENLDLIARRLTRDLATIGRVTYEPRLSGLGLIEDGVMFGFVAADGTVFLRANAATAHQFHALGSTKHPQMPYWSVPPTLASNTSLLRDLAYEAADMAHLAVSFGFDDCEAAASKGTASLSRVFSLALALAA